MRCEPDPNVNLDKAAQRVRDAAKAGAQIVCLPELFRAPYFCQTEDHAKFDLAEPIPGPSTERLGRVAREAGVVVVASLFERRAAGLYHNTAAVLDADGGLEFWGASFVSDPFGMLLQRASHADEELVVVPCDLRKQEEIRQHWPFLRDRRIDAYGDLTRRFIEEG